jgi:iron complex transport system ATP-binding protein
MLEPRSPTEPFLDVENLSVHYGAVPVLQGINLQVHQGEVMALIGPNGAGKTTLIRAVGGTIKPSDGHVRILGQALELMSASKRASSLAVVPQARNLPEAFTVWQTVLMGRTPYLGWLGQPSQADTQKTAWALERTASLSLAERPIGKLSGGEQQRILLARALAQDTPVLLLDEPTAHLDLRHQSSLLNLVRELAQERGIAVLMALHDLNLVSLYADRVVLLAEGQMQVLGTPAEVLTETNLVAAYQVPLNVVPHPDYGTPLILPDGRR